MFRQSQNPTRTFFVRIAIFLASAGAVQVLANFVSHSNRIDPISPVAVGMRNSGRNGTASFPVAVENVPPIQFPTSFPTIRNLDFWTSLTMVVNADGSVRDIRASRETGTTVAEQPSSDEVQSGIKGEPTDEMKSELVELLTNQVKEAKFKPRTFNGEALPTMVIVTSHFQSGNSCPKIVTEFKSTGSVIWTGTYGCSN